MAAAAVSAAQDQGDRTADAEQQFGASSNRRSHPLPTWRSATSRSRRTGRQASNSATRPPLALPPRGAVLPLAPPVSDEQRMPEQPVPVLAPLAFSPARPAVQRRRGPLLPPLPAAPVP